MSSSFTPPPAPRARLAGCIWLPRIIWKARQLSAGTLPSDFETRFCHPGGVDGQFLGFFGLKRENILDMAALDDAAAAAQFRSFPGVNATRIAEWNEVAVNLGRPGYPMAERLPIAKATVYQHVASDDMETVFEVLEADDRASFG